MTDELLQAIAEHGEREHVLRELESRGAMGELSARDVAREECIDVEDTEAVARTFVEAWDTWVQDTYSHEQYDEWLAYVEEQSDDSRSESAVRSGASRSPAQYGEQADEILD